MALINRISRLFQADFHAVLDRIEEPEQLLRQAIRDMEDELADSEQRIRACTQEQETLDDRKAALGDRLADLEQELDLCFASQKDELARGLIRRKLEAQRLSKKLGAITAANAKYLAEEHTRLDENRNALESLKQKAEIFSKRAPVAGAFGFEDASWLARELNVSDAEIEIAFLREQEARRAS
jgi:phage shock protein A